MQPLPFVALLLCFHRVAQKKQGENMRFNFPATPLLASFLHPAKQSLSVSKRSLATTAFAMNGRKISQVVPPTQSGPIYRLIGTDDIDGKGTNHPLPQVDPFMLLDQASIPQSDLPPFGAHPHRGHSVVTILTKGQEKSWDSFGQESTTVKAPASYWVDAGSGIFHDEVSVVPDPQDPEQHVNLFQLWVSVKEEDRLKPASLQYDSDLPLVDATNEQGEIVGSIQYYVGGGASIETPHPITVAYVSQNKDTTLKIPVDSSYGGFIVNVSGGATFAGTTKPEQTNEVLVLSDTASEEENYVQVTTSADAVAEYLLCAGEKIGEPWYKKLVASGAVIAKTPEEARQIAARVETYSQEGKSTGNFAPFGASLPLEK